MNSPLTPFFCLLNTREKNVAQHNWSSVAESYGKCIGMMEKVMSGSHKEVYQVSEPLQEYFLGDIIKKKSRGARLVMSYLVGVLE